MKTLTLTKHERHARLVKIVRRSYQEKNPGSRLFNNTTGTGWTANDTDFKNGILILKEYRPLNAGIPSVKEGGGGSDLLGQTQKNLCELFQGCLYDGDCSKCSLLDQRVPILTTIEGKTGDAKLRPNQKRFKKWVLSVGGIYFVARECTCHTNWEPVYKSGRIIQWKIPHCDICGGDGYILEG